MHGSQRCCGKLAPHVMNRWSDSTPIAILLSVSLSVCLVNASYHTTHSYITIYLSTALRITVIGSVSVAYRPTVCDSVVVLWTNVPVHSKYDFITVCTRSQLGWHNLPHLPVLGYTASDYSLPMVIADTRTFSW